MNNNIKRALEIIKSLKKDKFIDVEQVEDLLDEAEDLLNEATELLEEI